MLLSLHLLPHLRELIVEEPLVGLGYELVYLLYFYTVVVSLRSGSVTILLLIASITITLLVAVLLGGILGGEDRNLRLPYVR